MTGPGGGDGLAQNLRYLIARFDEHLAQHQRDLRDALDQARRGPRDLLLLVFTAVMSVSSLVAVIVTHH